MLKFKSKFKFGTSDQETPPSLAKLSAPPSVDTSMPELAQLSLSDAAETPTAVDLPAASGDQPVMLATNPGVLIVKLYRSKNVVLPISINNDKQILQALAQNANDAKAGALLADRLKQLYVGENAGEALSGRTAAQYLPANVDIPSSTGTRVVKPLVFMTVEFDNNMILVESRKGTVDAFLWDRVMTFDVTKMLAHAHASSNFLNINLYLQLPTRLVPGGQREAHPEMFTRTSSNTFGDLYIGQIKLPLNLRCHSKPVRLLDHKDLSFTTNLDAADSVGEISISIDFKPLLKSHLSIEDFDLLKVIGKGSFGKVMQVMKKDTKQIYALKTLRKQHIVSRMEVMHTLAERTVLARINCPFIVPLKFSFQSPEKLYLVLSFVNGGELFYHLQKARTFVMDRARFYIAELLCALESLHELNVIYRDLKPENILIDYQGHIALCDFGLCKLNMRNDDKTNTFCGTPEYLAPELLLNRGYTRSVDWWTLGTLLYEMLTGLPPFYDEAAPVMYKKILEEQLVFPPFLEGTEAQDLLIQLLQKDPAKRLDDAQLIKNHNFFKDIDWIKLVEKAYVPPFKPNVNGFLDTLNFDQNFTSERPQDSVVDDFLSESVQKQFGGWTYNGETVL